MRLRLDLDGLVAVHAARAAYTALAVVGLTIRSSAADRSLPTL
jgi:hypothetical protein